MMFRRWLYVFLFALGFGIAIGAHVYHLMAHPEWTEAQTFRALWWVYVVVALLMTPLGRRLYFEPGKRWTDD